MTQNPHEFSRLQAAYKGCTAFQASLQATPKGKRYDQMWHRIFRKAGLSHHQ